MTDRSGTTIAAVSVSLPSVRYSAGGVKRLVAALSAAADSVSAAMDDDGRDSRR